jgi:hypothetical protein
MGNLDVLGIKYGCYDHVITIDIQVSSLYQRFGRKADDQIRINSRSILSISRSKSPNITRKRGRVQRGFTREVSLGHVIKSPVLMIRAFADFCLSSVILHVFAFNFLG